MSKRREPLAVTAQCLPEPLFGFSVSFLGPAEMQIELRDDLDWSLDAGHHAGLHRVSDDAMAPLSKTPPNALITR